MQIEAPFLLASTAKSLALKFSPFNAMKISLSFIALVSMQTLLYNAISLY